MGLGHDDNITVITVHVSQQSDNYHLKSLTYTNCCREHLKATTRRSVRYAERFTVQIYKSINIPFVVNT